MSAETRTLLRKLTLPFECLKTVYEGGSEVRVYRNEITGQIQVGKRIDILGLDQTVAVREATLLTTIQHPNVVPVSEVVRVDGYDPALDVIELIMPFYDRGSVFEALQAGERFSLAQARTLAVEALLGTAEINECHGILHRDHKSPNVLIDDDGHARIGDLGVAVPMEADGTAEGYPNAQLFTPPETFTTGRISRASEIYQLGLVAFELINGPFPYDDNPIGEVMKRLEKGRRGPRACDLAAFQPYVPRRMRSVINKAIGVDPAHRHQNAMQLADALRSVRLIDWRHLTDDPDRKLWEGAIVRRPDRCYRVEAKQRRNGNWTLSGFQRVSQWRRVLPDQIVSDPVGKEAAGFFEAILVAATSA